MLIILVMAGVFTPVLAHSAALGTGPDQFDQGIPVYWPYHAFLMTLGVIFIILGFVVMRYRRTANWYKTHMFLEISGALSAGAGLSVGAFMVSLSGISHFAYTHGQLGIAAFLLMIGTPITGYYVLSRSHAGVKIHTVHRGLGGITITLMFFSAALGATMMAAVLAQ